MPIARQLAVASLGLAALATTSCPATRAQSGAEHASTMTAVTRAGAYSVTSSQSMSANPRAIRQATKTNAGAVA